MTFNWFMILLLAIASLVDGHRKKDKQKKNSDESSEELSIALYKTIKSDLNSANRIVETLHPTMLTCKKLFKIVDSCLNLSQNKKPKHTTPYSSTKQNHHSSKSHYDNTTHEPEDDPEDETTMNSRSQEDNSYDVTKSPLPIFTKHDFENFDTNQQDSTEYDPITDHKDADQPPRKPTKDPRNYSEEQKPTRDPGENRPEQPPHKPTRYPKNIPEEHLPHKPTRDPGEYKPEQPPHKPTREPKNIPEEHSPHKPTRKPGDYQPEQPAHKPTRNPGEYRSERPPQESTREYKDYLEEHPPYNPTGKPNDYPNIPDYPLPDLKQNHYYYYSLCIYCKKHYDYKKCVRCASIMKQINSKQRSPKNR